MIAYYAVLRHCGVVGIMKNYFALKETTKCSRHSFVACNSQYANLLRQKLLMEHWWKLTPGLVQLVDVVVESSEIFACRRHRPDHLRSQPIRSTLEAIRDRTHFRLKSLKENWSITTNSALCSSNLWI